MAFKPLSVGVASFCTPSECERPARPINCSHIVVASRARRPYLSSLVSNTTLTKRFNADGPVCIQRSAFSAIDNKAIEAAPTSTADEGFSGEDQAPVVTDGGRYEVDVGDRVRNPVRMHPMTHHYHTQHYDSSLTWVRSPVRE